MAKKTFHGSCRCEKVTFEVDLDFSTGTHKCNCTICWKHRARTVRAEPASFRALGGEDAFDPSKRFCTGCGVTTYMHVPAMEWNPNAYVAIAVAALDDLEPAELLAAPVTYYDGRANNWWETPSETRHL